jgi:ABC-type polysaccharide/polyol phosphate transport system ATPase subunit
MLPVLKVQGVSKRYRVGERARYRSLRESITGAIQRSFYAAMPFAHQHRSGHSSNEAELWALRDVSFDVMPGEVVGIIGRNGAGKSTLLKILARVTKPTRGGAEIYGRVGSLLEVGTGFHPELTGRENIHMSGAILGMRRREILRKLDQIVAFAEIDQFIDTPVKHYSSGMYVRLAFSVAAHLEPSILLVDEVLAVGDIAFWQKSIDKIKQLNAQGMTILLVTHNLWFVQTLCSHAMLLDHGSITAAGAPPAVIGRYQQIAVQSPFSGGSPQRQDAQIVNAQLIPLGEWISGRAAAPNSGLLLRFAAQVARHCHVRLQVMVTGPDGFVFFSVASDPVAVAADGYVKGEVSILHLMLKHGDYDAYLQVYSTRQEPELLAETCLRLMVEENNPSTSSYGSFWNTADWMFH